MYALVVDGTTVLENTDRNEVLAAYRKACYDNEFKTDAKFVKTHVLGHAVQGVQQLVNPRGERKPSEKVPDEKK